MQNSTIYALTPGVSVPSRRFRWAQYVEVLHEKGFETNESTSVTGAYAPASFLSRPFWLASNLVENLYRTIRSNKADLRFLQRNLTATLCTWEPLLKRPFVFDVDDAIFLEKRGFNADTISKASSLTICGNDFLANHFSKYGSVAVLPTAVDPDYFFPKNIENSSEKLICWSGSSSGLKYLNAIEGSISIVLKKYPDVFLKVICDKAPEFKKIRHDRIIYEPWSKEREVAALQECAVGLMPLEDDLWARGKCSFKMLTYMAVGIPVVVSPVGMNVEVLAHGPCGFAASNAEDWVDAISFLLEAETAAKQMGKVGRRIIETTYAKNIVGSQLAQKLAALL